MSPWDTWPSRERRDRAALRRWRPDENTGLAARRLNAASTAAVLLTCADEADGGQVVNRCKQAPASAPLAGRARLTATAGWGAR